MIFEASECPKRDLKEVLAEVRRQYGIKTGMRNLILGILDVPKQMKGLRPFF